MPPAGTRWPAGRARSRANAMRHGGSGGLPRQRHQSSRCRRFLPLRAACAATRCVGRVRLEWGRALPLQPVSVVVRFAIASVWRRKYRRNRRFGGRAGLTRQGPSEQAATARAVLDIEPSIALFLEQRDYGYGERAVDFGHIAVGERLVRQWLSPCPRPYRAGAR